MLTFIVCASILLIMFLYDKAQDKKAANEQAIDRARNTARLEAERNHNAKQ